MIYSSGARAQAAQRKVLELIARLPRLFPGLPVVTAISATAVLEVIEKKD